MQITIDEGIKEIEAKKYMAEYAVKEFAIPKSVEKIGDCAFSVYTDMLPSLEKFIVDSGNKYFDEIDNVLVSKDHKKLVAYPIGRKGKYIVPEGIEIIGRYAFRMAIYLEEIVLPKSVKKIEKGAFYYCKSLKKVDFGNAKVSVLANAFEKCDELADAVGMENIVDIGKQAFIKCPALKEIIIGDRLKSIGAEAFYGVNGTRFRFGNGITDIGDKAFVGKNIYMEIHRQQEKLIRLELFAMNGMRKFAVNVCLLDDKNKMIKLEGKAGEGNHNILIKDGRLTVTETDNKNVCVPKEEKEFVIKPVLLDKVEGTIAGKDIRFSMAGFHDGLNVFTDTTDDGYMYRNDRDFDSVMWIKGNKIKIIGIRDLIYNHIWKSSMVGFLSYGDFRVLQKSEHKFVPYVYPYKDGEILIDFTSQYEGADNKTDDAVSIIIEKVEIWKININGNSRAVLITDNESDEYKYIIAKNHELNNHYKSVEEILCSKYMFSKEDFKKEWKYKFEDFTVPDTEESLCYFWKDNDGRIFNYGKCVVYDKSKKGDIGVRNRSFINIYRKNGEKTAKVKFAGTPVHIEQKGKEYLVLTQQDCNTPKKSVVRLYKFIL